MRPVSGFERPAFQWAFVVLGVILIGVAGGSAWIARRASGAAHAARAAEESGRLERQHLEAELARERSARESLALELARARQGTAASSRVPTLTLVPLTTRSASPPDPSVTPRHAPEAIELRLVLPAAAKPYARFDVVWRDWSSGLLIWSRGGLAATDIDGRPGVTTWVPGDVLGVGAYEILLTGVTRAGGREDVAAYEVAVK